MCLIEQAVCQVKEHWANLSFSSMLATIASTMLSMVSLQLQVKGFYIKAMGTIINLKKRQ